MSESAPRRESRKPPQWGHPRKLLLKGWWNGGPARSSKNKLKRKARIGKSRGFR